MNETELVQRREPHIIFRIIQWIAASIPALMLLGLIGGARRLDIAGAPVILFFVAAFVAAAVAIALSPLAFFRLRWKGRIAAYIGILPAMVLFGVYSGQMNTAYYRTPAGRREITEREVEEAKIAARRNAERAAYAKAHEAEAAEAKETERLDMCQNLVAQIDSLSTSNGGPKVIEVNAVSVAHHRMNYTHPLQCDGIATTSKGDYPIEYGLEITPQGNRLVTMLLVP